MIYDIAGLRVFIDNKYPYTNKFCEKYLSDDQDGAFDLLAKVTEEEFLEEKASSPNFSDGYIENICLYRSICRQLPLFNRFLLHAAILGVDEKGYAFLGRSGTGKSTHTGLWLQYISNAKIVNGDKPIIEYCNGEFIAYGTPWMGKERLGYNGKGVLKALCFLEQAKVNEIERLKIEEVSTRLFNQLLMPTEFEAVSKTMDLADELIKRVPSYLLKCDISDEAFKTSFNCIVGGIR